MVSPTSSARSASVTRPTRAEAALDVPLPGGGGGDAEGGLAGAEGGVLGELPGPEAETLPHRLVLEDQPETPDVRSLVGDGGNGGELGEVDVLVVIAHRWTFY